MPTVEIVEESPLPPESVLAAAYDFSERRSKIFSAVQPKVLRGPLNRRELGRRYGGH